VSTFAQSGAARGDNNSRIGYYRFMVYGDDHQRAEDLGIRDMRDDADAQSFGYRVMRDLMQTDAVMRHVTLPRCPRPLPSSQFLRFGSPIDFRLP
jgi:hypothetical protein